MSKPDKHEMKEGYDDSVFGFNEAWDIMGEFLDEKIADSAKAE